MSVRTEIDGASWGDAFEEESVIDSAAGLEEFVGRVRADGDAVIAVDTEADSMHSYDTKLCLIQFASRKRLAIIDPLRIDAAAMSPFLDLMDATEVVWMHGADYDMSMFRKAYDRIPRVVWDTQTAARLTGVEQFGLANLIEAEFGIKLSKQSQKADWGQRPLPDKMLAYAFNDVRYMLTLAERFLARLRESGRMEWFEESCVFSREIAANREEKPADDAWRVTGWGNLDRRGLSFLKSLWHWRDEECRLLDRPPFKLISNQEIVNLSEKLQRGERIEPPRYLRPPVARRLLKRVADARNIPESEWPRKFRRNGGPRLQIDEDRLNALRNHRNSAARKLKLDPTLIAPRAALEKLAALNVDDAEKEGLLLRWQRDLMNL